MESFYLQRAESSVLGYAQMGDSVVERSKEAVDCLDCEAFLEYGIDCFELILHIDEIYRRLETTNPTISCQGFEERLYKAVEDWLAIAPTSIEWADSCLAAGFDVAHIDRFRECLAEAKAISRSEAMDFMTDKVNELANAALVEYANGQTAEGFPRD